MVEGNGLKLLERPEVIGTFWAQRRHTEATEAPPAPIHEKFICVAPDGWNIPCNIFPGEPAEPFVLFFPAEYDTEADILYLASALGQFGMTLASLSWRGRGDSKESPGFFNLPGDGDTFFQKGLDLKSERGYTGPLVLMGRSIGAAIALDVAARNPAPTLCLVLESTFDRTDDFLAGKGIDVDALGLRGKDPFCNRTKMLGYQKPVLFLHSSRDPVVSITQVEWLVCNSRSKATQFQIVPSPDRESLARSTGEFYANAVKEFIHLRMGRRPPRKAKAAEKTT